MINSNAKFFSQSFLVSDIDLACLIVTNSHDAEFRIDTVLFKCFNTTFLFWNFGISQFCAT